MYKETLRPAWVEVNLDNLERTGLFYKILRHDTHSRANLQYGQVWAGIYRVSYALGYR